MNTIFLFAIGGFALGGLLLFTYFAAFLLFLIILPILLF